ncbi:unnamed protein product [Prunus armeniaca]
MSCVDALFERVNLERSVESSAGEKARTFGVGRTCRRQGGRSSRQASDTSVVPAEGSPMLKLAICGNFGRITVNGSGNESFAQSFDVGLCASCYGGDTCLWRLGSTVESFSSRELRQVPAASKEYLPLARKKRQSEPPALDIVVRVDLFILRRASAQSRRNRGIGPEIRQVIRNPSPNLNTARTKVPEVEVYLYRQGKGLIDTFRTSLGGWDQNQLEVRDILDK